MLSDSEDIEMYQDYMIDFLYDKRDKYKWIKLDIANAEKCSWNGYIINMKWTLFLTCLRMSLIFQKTFDCVTISVFIITLAMVLGRYL